MLIIKFWTNKNEAIYYLENIRQKKKHAIPSLFIHNKLMDFI